MPAYPNTVIPSSVSPPAISDPMFEFETDSGVSIRRVKHSRPLRRWTLEYLGKTTAEMREIRGFLEQQRLGTLEFAWVHPTAADIVAVSPTTPVTLQWPGAHGLYSGQWVFVTSSPNVGINNNVFAVTYIDPTIVTLVGSVASGVAGNGAIQVFVPHARASMQEQDTFPSPAILIGPEQFPAPGRRTGYYNFSVQIQELF